MPRSKRLSICFLFGLFRSGGLALGALGLLATLSCGGAQKQRKHGQDLPPLKVDPFAGLDSLGKDDKQPFTFRTGPKPPPDITKKETLRFPVAQQAKLDAQHKARQKPAGPLKVTRKQPSGAVSNVGAVTVSFDQPMVPVASLAQLRTLPVPLKIDPQPKGRWRWLGTRTVAFEPEGRMPYATDYTVTIPAGTRSAVGGRLERTERFTFSTPTAKLVAALPSRYSHQTRPDSAIALLFNQKIDSEQLLSLLTIHPGNLKGQDVELVPPTRWAKLRDIGHFVATWDPERVIVLQPKKPLAKGSTHTLRIAAGLRGEGPKVTPSTLNHYFRTYSPLRVDWIRCGDWQKCSPRSGFQVRFNNPLVTTDMKAFVSIEPVVADLELQVSGQWVHLKGSFKPQTGYKIRVAGDKQGNLPIDIHEQKLVKERTASLRTGDLPPQLSFPVKRLATIERTGKRLVPLSVTNVQTSRLRMVKVAPEQLFKVLAKASYSWDNNGRRDPLEGIKGIKVRRTLRTGIKRNGEGKVGIATDEALGKNGSGPVYIELRSEQLRRYYRYANIYRGLVVQVTDLAVMARYDSDRIVGLVTHTQTGKIVPGARAMLRDRNGVVIWQGKTDAQGMIEAPGRRELWEKASATLVPGQRAPAPFVLWVEHGSDKAFVILDQSGDDGVYLSTYGSWGGVPAKKALRMHLFTDRSPYRPKETVHVKGVLRVIDNRPAGGVEPSPKELETVQYEVKTSRGHKIATGKAKVSPGGAFTFDVKIPPQSDLGNYSVRVKPAQGPYQAWLWGSFSVEEYRAPEFKVEVEVAKGPHFIGTTVGAKVGADYLFGAPMAGARVSWTLSRQQGHFSPPGNPGFSFAEPVPWNWRWRFRRMSRRHRGGSRMGYVWQQRGAHGTIIQSDDGLLGADGRVGLEAKLSKDPDDKRVGPLSFTLEAKVTDKNRQAIANRQTVVAHPASLYVGLRPKKSVIKAGEQLDVDAVLVDLEGKRLVGRALTLRALQVETKVSTVFKDGRWTYKYESKDRERGSCKLTTAAEPKRCALTLPKVGAYKLQAEARDAQGRKTRTTVRVYAFGPGYVPWNLKNQSKIELVPDKKSYAPGDVAKILVKSPLRSALGLLSLQRGGIVKIEKLQLAGNAQVIEVPITEAHIPGLHVAVALGRGRINDKKLGKAAKDLGRPTFAHGTVRLAVSAKAKALKVTVKPQREVVGPSQPLEIALELRDAAGKPVQGEIAVMIVDEGVLSLLGFQTPDPGKVFWAPRGSGAPLADLRNALLGREKKLQAERRRSNRQAAYRRARSSGLLGTLKGDSYGVGGLGLRGRGRGGGDTGATTIGIDSLRAVSRGPKAKLAEASPAASGADAPDDDRAASPAPARIRSRSNFATTAFYDPSVLTDAQGRAKITVKMPDNLTTFRIMAVALHRGRADVFGKGEGQVKVRKALLLRPSLPRFLSVGDSFEAAVVVHNETDAAGDIDVLVRGRNAQATDGNRKRVRIAAHGSQEVRFAMSVKEAGPARIQFAAVLGQQTDGVEKQVPVLLPVTTEAFATYGMTEKSVAQPVVPPKDALAGYGGLEVSLSSTALNGLEDSVRYLVEYPWECTEQTASRVIPIFALRDILGDFNIGKLKDLKRRKALARAGLRKLISYQRYDGGWGYWQGSRKSWLYLSAYATLALLAGQKHGEKVPVYNLGRAKRFLKYRLDHPYYWERLDWTGQTAAAWVLSSLKQYEKGHLSRLYGLHKQLPMFARAWLMVALFRSEGKSARVQELLRQLDNAAVQTASAAHFSEGDTESLRLLMHSNDRTDAIVLEALLEVAPMHRLMPKIARGLLQARVRGRWSTTQANAYALMALSRYYKQVEKVVPDHISQLWYGEEFMGAGTFKGRQMKVVQQTVPMDALRKFGERSLVLAKRGQGKLYYRIGLRYAPQDLVLPPEEQGFAVSRVYESIRDPQGKKEETVRRLKDGSWEIKAGATVRVRLVVVVPDRRYFVSVMDPLPAGLEAVNLRLKTSASSRLAGQLDHKVYDSWSWYSLFAFDHKELRDDRVVLFSDRLPAGVYEYTYLARATTYGSFVVAPAKAEEMYRPETFGRNGTTRVHVR